jgi:hypothetical protein
VVDTDDGSNNEIQKNEKKSNSSAVLPIPTSIGHSRLPKKEAFTFLPKCDHCHIYNGFKIGNPIAQLVDDVGTTKYESLQSPEIWFDAPTIISYEIACFHSIHPEKVSMFTHMGIPHMVSKDNSEYGDDDIQQVLLNQAGSEIPSSTPTNMILDLNHGKDRHLGIVYSQSHFGVIEFILNQQIIVIYDGLDVGQRRIWRKEIKTILQQELSILGDKVDRYTYAKRNIRYESTTSYSLQQIRTWVEENKTKLPGKWMAMYSEDFNTVKREFSKLTDMKDYEASLDPGASIFANLAYRPEIIQRDGGYVCGALACQALHDLLLLNDEHAQDDVYENDEESYMYRSIIRVETLRLDREKSKIIRKSVMDNHMLWLHKMNEDGELDALSRHVR